MVLVGLVAVALVDVVVGLVDVVVVVVLVVVFVVVVVVRPILVVGDARAFSCTILDFNFVFR